MLQPIADDHYAWKFPATLRLNDVLHSYNRAGNFQPYRTVVMPYQARCCAVRVRADIGRSYDKYDKYRYNGIIKHGTL